MKKKLDLILLIDDSEPTNYLHQMVIEDAEITKKCIAIDRGEDALAFLSTKADGEYPNPDIIFLDINMPEMDGWEFLEEYFKLAKEQQAKFIVCMLSTSLNPDDKEKAEKLLGKNGFANKPLTEELLIEVIQRHFPQNF